MKKIKIISDFNIEPLGKIWENIDPSYKFILPSFGQVYQELLDGKDAKFDSVVVWTLAQNVLPSFQKALNNEEFSLDEVINEALNFANLVVDYSKKCYMLFFCSWHVQDLNYSNSLTEWDINVGSKYILSKLNSLLAEKFAECKSIKFLDTEKWIDKKEDLSPSLLWYSAKIPYSNNVFKNSARFLANSINSIKGEVKKLIVVDLDNTLWGGICGEVERVEELTLGIDGSAATAYLRLQQTARRLKESGVLLALLSKNKESSVFKVFEEHPSMTLNKNDIAAWQVNWDNKYKNIRKLANELNLSLDAFVLIDDSKNEIDEMTHFCPEVWSIHLDQDTLSNFETIIRKLGFFEKSKITESDKLRTDHFIKEKLRVETRTNSQDYESYLNSLEMVLKTSIGLSVNKSRVEQMAARTNQMNLNNWRISNVEIDTLVYQEQKHLVSFSLIDKFGDLGDIGVLAFTIDEEKTEIELFILSCRAFGRSVEYAMLKFVEDHAKKNKCKKITAIRKPTKKNLLIMDCFDACGYTKSSIGLDYLFSKNLGNTEQQAFPKLNHIQTNYEDDQKDSK